MDQDTQTAETLEAKRPLSEATRKAQLQLKGLNMYRQMAYGTGTIAGAYVAYQKGLGFWGYVGHMLLGSILIGGTFYVATTPFEAKFKRTIEEDK